MIRLLTALLLLVVFIGCNEGDARPPDVLPQARMEKVVWDIIQADEFVQNYVMKDSLRIDVDSARYAFYEQVFSLHGTNRQQFRKSYEYYTANPAVTRTLFDSLSNKANRRMRDIYNTVQ
jgi:hypothetical protein